MEVLGVPEVVLVGVELDVDDKLAVSDELGVRLALGLEVGVSVGDKEALEVPELVAVVLALEV